MKKGRKAFSPENKSIAERKVVDWGNRAVTRSNFEHKEGEVGEWIEQVVQEKISYQTVEELGTALSDGYILCRLIQALVPGMIKKLPLRRIDKVSTFISVCHKIGVVKEQLFDPQDLIYQRNMVMIISIY
eukprot:TRINITY_DN12596_c0_g1_i1.p1 TRINITY_DN12596_c0_g1~~TRINITY_DN12596_c0_g1_i1.p1  ORF type:complete len:130 (+),score=25.56 TRINITY_DN12596_c0_g1_i1:114-503(+)